MKFQTNPVSGAFDVPVPENFEDIRKLIQSDYFRISGKICSLWEIFMAYRKNHCVKILLFFRLCQCKWGWIMRSFAIRYYNRLQIKYNIFLPWSTLVGYGFYIGHGLGLVVNGSAIIGNNVNLSQFTTIGSNHNHAAFIGDDVYVGPSVCIVENVQIGCQTAQPIFRVEQGTESLT